MLMHRNLQPRDSAGHPSISSIEARNTGLLYEITKQNLNAAGAGAAV